MEKLSVIKVDDLILQVAADNGGRVSSKALRESIDAKPLTIGQAAKRLVKSGALVRLGRRGRFALPGAVAEVEALVSEACNAGLDCRLDGDDRVSISLENLKTILDK